MSPWRRTHLIALAVLVAAFVALYPYLDSMGYCAEGGCPEMTQASHAASSSFSATCCPVAVLVAAPAAFAFASFHARRSADRLRLTSLYLSPDPPPPRVFQTA